ncbi:hypothetical protein [Streptomyces sp. NPDC000618]|uniref:hypothetical protein n=1 Tax=Streptomyces sp. NPDC000618 TaxID=3154265 RepID=UPI003333A27A
MNRTPVPGSRRVRRRPPVPAPRAQDSYGPTFREVLPGFLKLGLAVGLSVALLAWAHRLGILGLTPGLAVLGAVAVVLTRWRRAAVRRRRGVYTAAELVLLDDDQLMAAVERILRRDGWDAIAMPSRGRPRLYARDRGGRRLDVVLSPAENPADDEARTRLLPTEESPQPPDDEAIRLLVTRPSAGRTDAARPPLPNHGVLLSGRHLQRWAAGTPLDELVLLERRDKPQGSRPS